MQKLRREWSDKYRVEERWSDSHQKVMFFVQHKTYKAWKDLSYDYGVCAIEHAYFTLEEAYKFIDNYYKYNNKSEYPKHHYG